MSYVTVTKIECQQHSEVHTYHVDVERGLYKPTFHTFSCLIELSCCFSYHIPKFLALNIHFFGLKPFSILEIP